MLLFGPTLSTPVLALHEWFAFINAQAVITASEAESTTHYAATRPFISRATDVPADQPFSGTLAATLRVDRSIVGGDGFGAYALNVSEATLINADGQWDSVIRDDSVNGQETVFTIGEMVGRDIVAPYAQFEPIARLRAVRWRPGRDQVIVEFSDLNEALNVPVQTEIYTGAGELEGGEELANLTKPWGDGAVRYASPTLVIAADGLWQATTVQGGEITGVQDGAVDLEFTEDCASVADLRALTPAELAPGQFATANNPSDATGMFFRLGGRTKKRITCHFNGPHETTADIIEYVALNSAGIDADDIETFTFQQLNDDLPAVRGYFIPAGATKTCADMFADLMRPVPGWYGITTLGKLRVHMLKAPEGIAAESFDTNFLTSGGSLVSIDMVPLPAGVDPPPQRWRVTWEHNWTPQPDLYEVVSEDDPALAEYLRSQFKVASTSEAQRQLVLADYPNAPDPEAIPGYFRDEADALEAAERLYDLYTQNFKLYRIVAKRQLFMRQLGEEIRVTDNSIVPRLGLESGRDLRLVEVNDSADDLQTEMLGFG